jgi:hypothetical protein
MKAPVRASSKALTLIFSRLAADGSDARPHRIEEEPESDDLN